MSDRYVQQLPTLGLSIEQGTDRVPDAVRFHVFKDSELVGSFKKLSDAQKLFARLRDESGWKPPEREEMTTKQIVAREKDVQDRLAHVDYWSQSHKFRGGGRPRRRQGR